MATTVQLANGRGVALIDDDDAVRLPFTGWYLHGQGYAARASDGRFKSTLLHRIILNVDSGTEIDHINGNKLDCQKMNLRRVTRSQNNQNRRTAQSNNRLGVRGVSLQRNRSGSVSYFARVTLNGRPIHRCGFKTVAEAAQAARELRRKYFTHSPECSSGQ